MKNENSKLSKTQLWLSAAAVIALAAACGGAKPPEADVEACEHLQEGPATAVTAASAATDGGVRPLVDDDHRRYDITLKAEPDGKFKGSVEFAASAPQDHVFFLDVDVPLSISEAGGKAVVFEEEVSSSPVCTDVKARKTARLDIGTHVLTFGPAAAADVSLVIEMGDHEGHEGEGGQ